MSLRSDGRRSDDTTHSKQTAFQVTVHLRAQRPEQGDEYPACVPSEDASFLHLLSHRLFVECPRSVALDTVTVVHATYLLTAKQSTKVYRSG